MDKRITRLLTKRNKTILAVLGVFILIVGFGTMGGKKWLKRHNETLKQREEARLDSLQRRSDSIIELKQLKADSLGLVIQQRDFEIDDLSQRNNSLYWTLKQRDEEIQTLRRDMSFISNAERIADSVNRHTSRTNDLR